MKKILILLLLAISSISFGQKLTYVLESYVIISTTIDPNDANKLLIDEKIITKISGSIEGKFLQSDDVILSLNSNLSAKEIAESLQKENEDWVDQHYNNK